MIYDIRFTIGFARRLTLHALTASGAVLFSSVLALAADSSIQVTSTAKTNAETASISIKDVYTRDGETNLVRFTKIKSGIVQMRMHKFYHAGSLVGNYIAMPDSSGFSSEAASPYSVSFEFDATHSPKSVVFGTKDGVVLDAFNYTNGVFSPVDGAVITKANRIFGGTGSDGGVK